MHATALPYRSPTFCSHSAALVLLQQRTLTHSKAKEVQCSQQKHRSRPTTHPEKQNKSSLPSEPWERAQRVHTHTHTSDAPAATTPRQSQSTKADAREGSHHPRQAQAHLLRRIPVCTLRLSVAFLHVTLGSTGRMMTAKAFHNDPAPPLSCSLPVACHASQTGCCLLPIACHSALLHAILHHQGATCCLLHAMLRHRSAAARHAALSRCAMGALLALWHAMLHHHSAGKGMMPANDCLAVCLAVLTIRD